MDITRKETMEKQREKTAAQREMLENLMDLMIESAPEETQVELKIAKTHSRLSDATRALAEDVTLYSSEQYSLEAKKEVLEYLSMVLEGIKTYTETIKKQ